MLAVSSELREPILRVMDLQWGCLVRVRNRPEFVIARWRYATEPRELNSSFMESLSLFVPSVKKLSEWGPLSSKWKEVELSGVSKDAQLMSSSKDAQFMKSSSDTLLTNSSNTPLTNSPNTPSTPPTRKPKDVQLTHDALLLHYKFCSHAGDTPTLIKHNCVETLIPCFTRDHCDEASLVRESAVLCPLSVTQVRCLECLWQRWGFVLKQNLRSVPIARDVVAGLLYELIRVYTHPFLSGCSENVLTEDDTRAWSMSFRKACAKVSVLEHMVKECFQVSIHPPTHSQERLQVTTHPPSHSQECLQVNKDTPSHSQNHSVVFIYSRTLRLCQYLSRYFLETHRAVVGLFGVGTLQQFTASVRRIRENEVNGVPTVVILGQMPTACSLCLDFVTQVILFDSDLVPASDIDFLRDKFHIGSIRVGVLVHPHVQPCSFYRLLLPLSFEIAWFYPEQVFLDQFTSFIHSSSNRLSDILM